MQSRNLLLPAAVALLSLFATAASAHTRLVKSSPADQAQVAPPARVELQFSDIVQLKSLTIQQGSARPRPLPDVPEKWADTFALPVEALPAGSYVLRWSAATEDGHTAEGQIRFTVQDAAHQHQHQHP